MKQENRQALRREFIDVTENTFINALNGRSGSLRAREIRSRAINKYGGLEA